MDIQGYTPRISIIIRNRNESQHLTHVFAALKAQYYTNYEIILVDNESTDNSVALAEQAGAKIVRIAKKDFTYGKAINVGFEAASGELCMLLSAHSLPMGHYFLHECVAPFTDERLAAARCTYAGKRSDVYAWLQTEKLDKNSPLVQTIVRGPLASGSVYRRKVWEEIKFDEKAEAAEEKLWTLEVLKKGYTTLANCGAVYSYIRIIPEYNQVQKDYREMIAVYKNTGLMMGVGNNSPAKAFGLFLRTLLVEIPLASIQKIKLAWLKMRLAMRTKKDSQKQERIGSVR